MSSSPATASVGPTLIANSRFANASEHDRSGVIWISTLLCLIYSALMLVLRAHLRWKVRSLDDYLLLGATFLQTGEGIAVIYSLKYGLGQSHLLLTTEQIYISNLAIFVGVLLFIVSTTLAKISVILLMMHLFNLKKSHASWSSRSRMAWLACTGAVFIVLLCGIASIIALSANCTISNIATLETANACSGQALRWDLITALDVSTEVLLVALSVLIVWPVQLKLYMKLPVVLVFSFRLGCAIVSIVHLHYIHLILHNTSKSSTSSDPGLAIVPVIVLMQVQLCWSMISATIPTIKSFIRSFNSGCGLGLDSEFLDTYGLTDLSRSRDNPGNPRNTDNDNSTIYELSTIKSRPSTGTNTMATTPRLHLRSGRSKSQQSYAPQRPSRENVDLEGIGFHAGIPAIPGFGAVSHTTVTKPTSNSVPASSPVSTSKQRNRKTSVYEIDGTEIMIRCSVGSESREHVIRKDVEYEVRYELA